MCSRIVPRIFFCIMILFVLIAPKVEGEQPFFSIYVNLGSRNVSRIFDKVMIWLVFDFIGTDCT